MSQQSMAMRARQERAFVGTWSLVILGKLGDTFYWAAMPDQALAIAELYAAFNMRDLDAALSLMHPEVEWPNGMEGGYVHGRDSVRDYWSRQWRLINPHVEPQDMTVAEDGRVVVAVHQTIRDLAGRVIKDETVRHIYRVEAGLIRGMEIQKP